MSIYLGFDFGMKHIGVAVGQKITGTATPLTTLNAKDGIPNWDEIKILIEKWQPRALIVGFPLNMDDSAQTMTFASKRFMNRLQAKYALPVHPVDERLTSWEAKKFLREEKTKKKIKTDEHALAASILLQQWLQDAKTLG